MKRIVLIIIAASAILATGCSSVSVQDSTGFLITRKSYWWSDTKISGFTLSIDTNGVRNLKLTGYNQRNEETIAGITEAMAAGFAAGMEAYQGRNNTP